MVISSKSLTQLVVNLRSLRGAFLGVAMSLLHIEGFESFGTSGAPVGLSRKYSIGSAGIIVTGRTGGFAYRTGGTTARIEPSIPSNPQTIFLGFGFKMDALGAESVIFLRSGSPTSNNIVVKTQANGSLQILRSSTVLGTTATGILIAGTWFYIELKATIDDAVGAYELRVDETTVLSDSGIDTKQGNEAWTNHIFFRGRNGTFTYYDDLYILDTNGTENNNFIGKSVVSALYPDGVGDNADFTPDSGSNFTRVNENPTDDDTSHVESSISTTRDLHTYDDDGAFSEIRGIQINTEVKDTLAAGASLKSLVKSGATLDSSSAIVIGGASYEYQTRILEQDPNTSAAWTPSAINAMQAGYEVG